MIKAGPFGFRLFFCPRKMIGKCSNAILNCTDKAT